MNDGHGPGCGAVLEIAMSVHDRRVSDPHILNK